MPVKGNKEIGSRSLGGSVETEQWQNMKNKHIGSHLDDFLKEEGILTEVETAAVKRVLYTSDTRARGISGG